MRHLVLLLAVLTCFEHALAAGGGHGTQPVTLGDSCLSELSSRQLTDLANQPSRVGGYWVNSNDWFYFAGDTKALNDFLRRYAKLTETPLVLVIHPGKAPAERCVGELFAEPYDWKLDSMYPAFTREKEWFRRPDGGQWRRVVIVQVWLGGNIRLNELKVSANIGVRPGGEIEKFAEEHNKKKAEGPDPQRDVVLRGAAASCRDLCLDIDDSAKVEQIGGATSSRCLRLAKGQVPVARWKLTETERGYLIQARAGKRAGWYLDFDDDAQIEEMGGATSSRNLLLTKEKVPGAYWRVTETDEGLLIQAQAGRFEGWYLDLDLLTKQRVEGAFWEFSPEQADSSMGEETRWGDPVRGVKMRLHAPRSRWAQGQTPELRVDFVNMNNERIDRLAFLKENWGIELDGRLYRVRTPDPGNWIDSPAFGPGAEQRDILVPLHEDFGWMDRSSLEFLPGKHTVRIHFTHNETVEVNDEYAEIHLVSNPVEIEIEDVAK